jgi:hypothetical protein
LLSRETVRALQPSEMSNVAGGSDPITISVISVSVVVSIMYCTNHGGGGHPSKPQ